MSDIQVDCRLAEVVQKDARGLGLEFSARDWRKSMQRLFRGKSAGPWRWRPGGR